MGDRVYKFRLASSYSTCVIDDGLRNLLDGVEFDAPWLKIEQGILTVPGGYAWDGCSPKWNVGGLVVGIPDGLIDASTLLPRTYHASLLHDALCQYQDRLPLTRAQIDRIFYVVLLRDGFSLPTFYYAMVRMFAAVRLAAHALVNGRCV